MQVAARAWGIRRLRQAAIQRPGEANTHEVEPVLIVRRHGKASVIVRPLEQIVILIDETPATSAVVRAIKTRILRLDERVHTIGIASRDLHRDLPHCLTR